MNRRLLIALFLLAPASATAQWTVKPGGWFMSHGFNAGRFPDYHRLDLSLTINRKKKPGKVYKNESNWVISVYNAYGRKNTYTLSTDVENGVPVIYQWYLFTYVPSVTYNFKF